MMIRIKSLKRTCKNSKNPKSIKNWEDTETAKWTQRELKKTLEQNQGNYLLKGINEIRNQYKVWKRNWAKL
jgi:hypothetical protein